MATTLFTPRAATTGQARVARTASVARPDAPVRWRALPWTALLAAGLVAAVLAAAVLTAPGAAARTAADPDLARLLRAMAAIKGILAALGAAAVGWRLRRPTPGAFAAGYLALVWTAGAATGAMWQLAGVGWAALALHVAGALLVVLAWRDAEFFPRPARVSPRSSAAG